MQSKKFREFAKSFYAKMAEAGVPSAHHVDAIAISEAAKMLDRLETDEALCIMLALLLQLDRSIGRRIAEGVTELREGGFC